MPSVRATWNRRIFQILGWLVKETRCFNSQKVHYCHLQRWNQEQYYMRASQRGKSTEISKTGSPMWKKDLGRPEKPSHWRERNNLFILSLTNGSELYISTTPNTLQLSINITSKKISVYKKRYLHLLDLLINIQVALQGRRRNQRKTQTNSLQYHIASMISLWWRFPYLES